ncbi:MAG: lytic transglycosylase domain-containing protein [Bacteroidales bacterium]|nr:lytic transglycosylase domain-containing protein [Bacteroidales bacterium]
MKKIAITAVILSCAALAGQVFLFATSKEDADDIYQNAIKADYRVYAPLVPDTATFCGEPVPLETFYVHEALDRELMVNMYGHTNMMLWLKRAARAFPVIEPILKKNGIPADMKYLCVAESGLAATTSQAGAQGYWQFMQSTGKTYGLEISDEIDMRNNLTLSTEAACHFLKKLYDEFGSWSMAAAAYNLGENGVRRRSKNQGVDLYWDLMTPYETTRYVFRIVAIKTIMQHPLDYGFHVRQCDLYHPVPTKEVTLEGQDVDLYAFARNNGTTYKMLRDLNPWIQTDKLKNKENKTYRVALPDGSEGTKNNVLNTRRHDTSLLESI